MAVFNTYGINGEAHTTRYECPLCNTVATSVTILVFFEPERGQGAYSLAKNIKQKSTAFKAVQKRIAEQFDLTEQSQSTS